MRQFNLSKYNSIKAALCIGAALLFHACAQNSNEKFGKINRNFSDRTTMNAHVVYKDSGYVRLDLKTPLIEEYTLIDSPYTIMRKGVNIHFWNALGEKPNFLRADWAKIEDAKKIYEGRGNVLMINNDGDTLRTNHIFWDRNSRRIFTKDTVKIYTIYGDSIVAKKGLDATEDFKSWVLYENSGIKVVNSDGKKPLNKKQKSDEQEKDKNSVPLEPIEQKDIQ